jgi:acyl dehydratase
VNTVDINELGGLVGQEIGTSPWVPITQERIDRFAAATDDRQWIHTDPDRAASGPYGGTIAHGYLTLSLLPSLIGDAVHLAGVATRINYGLEKVRFPAPVRCGASVRAVVGVAALEPMGSVRVRLGLRVVVEIEGEDRPACIAETLTVLVPAA